MKKVSYRIIGAMGIAIVMAGCNNDDDGDDFMGNWVERSVFDGAPRSGASSFTIGNTGYVGTGYDGDDYLSDFWSYNIEEDFWSQKADFPGVPRSAAVAFQVSDQGFIGSGYDGDIELGDFYKYDPNSNNWSPISDFAGSARRGAIGFNSVTMGYVGTGFDGDNDKKDFWSYNPSTDTWTEVVGYGGSKRRDAAVFVLHNKAYIGTGISNGFLEEDFWEFDMETGDWIKKIDLNDEDEDINVVRSNAIGFTIGNRGYYALGNSGAGADVTIWEYDANADKWEQKSHFERTPREDGVVFSNGTKAITALGRNGILYLDDAYEFFPFEELDEDD